jgi:hypothetical protein
MDDVTLIQKAAQKRFKAEEEAMKDPKKRHKQNFEDPVKFTEEKLANFKKLGQLVEES